MRSVTAVVVGYLVFGVSSAILFAASGQDPHLSPTPGFLVCSVVYGGAFAALGGYLAARIAGRREMLHASIVSAIIAVIAITSMIAEWRAGSVWSQLVVACIMAPAALAGGYLRGRTAPP